ncbi:RTA1 like protein-domain-containing protein [Xylariales sp. PMI_506]|nr:RTA1 like protein-domain-containing protein [Xylariales sp. PMI_506]
MVASQFPDYLISYGPDTNCTLALCPVEWSVLGYQPSLAASSVFIALFSIAAILHFFQGLRWGTWSFMICVVLGCIDEIIGYAGRIMLNNNPFSFAGFLIQIICITTAPVFFCAAIYVTLSRTINHLDESLSRFKPKLLYWFFIPCDIASLALQAGGGATSSNTSGSNKTGVNVSLAGLSFQVFTLVLFTLVVADYMIRFLRSAGRRSLDTRFTVFLFFLCTAILLILIRCAYRIDELSSGYSGTLFHKEGIFIGLESVLIVVATFCLNIGHPGLVLGRSDQHEKTQEVSGGSVAE